MDIKDESRKYSSRDEEIRATLTQKECIRLITNSYGSRYDPNTPIFDAWDQLLACEAIGDSTPVREQKQEQTHETNENVNGNGMFNDTRKHRVYFELTPSKQKVITELKRCNYRTPPIEIALLLGDLFSEYPTKDGHWLFISQRYNPRAILRVLTQIEKIQANGQKIITNPPGYFTYLIKNYRKPRRSI
ncbi:hypothetical protein A3D80_03510 [Candidatus Roizmanbacteria bacterium RIFCSPHIGHO2_02_FULL_40_13b]|uniref:Uncharacterized protein n=1 Tax=Candidatus Roizmanbacteria bacterium RIFCSPHIGHO2_01_FULL_39_24 TaxID=1802032 RepID=A0A1F7GJD4_9BACT|nr:MAG: hypothetical protein A2799_04305 [Candidatus Roizmanbacteria bacterium RIFCSPHIGHO2_01_FULL_39_24]OGK27033.1 MAG: hypothetical protein A3D80_03510 [Candidatus Roizmanbacteria bacterium RIFCSPHIGHO2_02_FULL_40_13b]OGK48812.1 MAG: hypothetical protein A3A56_01215 [Candidatus Roizmanbacteria bacterium RIFCSPLOWO2_01_FULL_40_32]OGK57298.1 MAG: hypothetical protein A3H83_00175 [Candidatus Roizmanbacteria bacterium RIFCSPLOWO2_02_FULL_39_8]